MPVLDTTALINNRIEAIQKYHVEAGIARAELDVSGGIDSAVMLMLLAEALGPDNVTAVYSRINSSMESGVRAGLVAKAAGVKLAEVSATGTYNVLVDACRQALREAGYDLEEIDARVEADPSIMGSLRSTLRAPIGRFMNRLTGGGIRHGTGNECEDRWIRFYQKGGDGEVDTNPLAMLSKGEVYQLAVALKVPEEIITCTPTPDLWGVGEEHNDEDEISKLSGVEWTYSRVDPQTGKYLRVGTIERMSRLLDTRLNPEHPACVKDRLFGSNETWGSDDEIIAKVLGAAERAGLSRAHLESARKWERITRHKMNPNCPVLGRREDLVYDKILTDELPAL